MSGESTACKLALDTPQTSRGSVCLWGVEFSSVTAEFPPCQKRVVGNRITQCCLRL